MYVSTVLLTVIIMALVVNLFLLLVTAYANRDLQRQNRNLRGRIQRKTDYCYSYHSPRPF